MLDMYHCIDHCWVTPFPCPIKFTGTHLYMWVKRAPLTESNISSPNSRLQPRLKKRNPLDPESSAPHRPHHKANLPPPPPRPLYNYRESSVIAICTWPLWWVKWGSSTGIYLSLISKEFLQLIKSCIFWKSFLYSNRKCKIINPQCS